MRTTVRLDDALMRAAKERAAQRGTTLTSVIEDALRAELAREASRDLEPFVVRTVRGTPVPGVDLTDNAALLELTEQDVPMNKRR